MSQKNQVRKYGEIASIKQIKGEYNCFKADKSLKMKDSSIWLIPYNI